MKPDDVSRAEWIAAMLELAARDPEAYEELKARAWEMLAATHDPDPREVN